MHVPKHCCAVPEGLSAQQLTVVSMIACQVLRSNAIFLRNHSRDYAQRNALNVGIGGSSRFDRAILQRCTVCHSNPASAIAHSRSQVPLQQTCACASTTHPDYEGQQALRKPFARLRCDDNCSPEMPETHSEGILISPRGCKVQPRKFQACFCPYSYTNFAALHGDVQACVIHLSKAPSYGPYLSKRGPHKGSPSRSGQADLYPLAAKFLTCCSFSPL